MKDFLTLGLFLKHFFNHSGPNPLKDVGLIFSLFGTTADVLKDVWFFALVRASRLTLSKEACFVD